MTPRIAVGPLQPAYAVAAVEAGGGQVVNPDGKADGLIWLAPRQVDALHDALEATGARWVQLPLAGVERFHEAGLFSAGPQWTSAKGSYAEPVAEHAVMLALAGLRVLPTRITATSWGKPDGISLYDRDVVILGAGGITAELLRLLAPWRVRATVVRRRPDPVEGAAATVGLERLDEVLAPAQVVFLALALTPQTRGVIAAPQLAAMRPDAWLVNVARGPHVDTDALVAALDSGAIGGAALDVTDPEPLPDGHPLWGRANCIITPHTADTQAMVEPLLARRISTNVRRFAAGEQLEGLVDIEAGY
ncbi:D-isomer specific 2-hydroxyacid dehydrogenase family protein [Acidiferrimicrobium sp. IK]|nr:D-isomer specific 2-hydroxyacid dehydrogenase family protein [Acidiferrimicrobium sp. IK]MCU4184905.1 D-isomer specific 2-hydroxyacid dehydrogenase family protein [Acidiferrimicrobium sp. IK]